MNAADRHRRAMALFDEACELPPDQRVEFLKRACGEDRQLLHDVVGLLEHDRSVAAIDGGGGIELLAAEFARASQKSPHEGEPVPERIGHYRIIRLVSQGGMGAVYEAEQENPKRRVALKMVRPGAGHGQLLKRLEHEAHVLGRLQHPGIAHVYEAGTAETGHGRQPYFAMEFIDGLPLTEFADRLRLGTHARMELIARVCDAVHYAHERGVIHRDLKPSNIFVSTEGLGAKPGDDPTQDEGQAATMEGEAYAARRRPRSEKKARRRSGGPLLLDRGASLPASVQPKVLDFGVARVTEADMQLVTLQTEVGQLVGTLSYMSPEQVGAQSSLLDRRCDVYAIGVLLHELLAGQLPHDIRHTTIPEAARIIRDEDPSRLGSINSMYRGDVEVIVSKALSKERERRYQSTAEMAADIRRFLNDQPIIARPASAFYQLRKFARRNKGLVGGMAMAFVVLVLGLVGVSWFAIGEADARRESDRALYRASLSAAAAARRENDVATSESHLDRAPEHLRGWEWEYLYSRLDQSMGSARFGAVPAGVDLPAPRGLAHAWFSDSDRLIHVVRFGRLDGERRLAVETWDASTFEQTGFWSLSDVQLVGPSDGGDTLIIQTADGRAEIREVQRGEVRRTIVAPMSAERRHLVKPLFPASAFFHNRSVLGQALKDSSIPIIAVSPDGGRACCASGVTVKTYSQDDYDSPLILEPHLEGIGDAAFGPAGRHLFTGGNNRRLACFDVEEGGRRVWQRPDAHLDAIVAVAVSPDGTLLASGGQDRVLRLWDARTGKPRGTLVGHKNPILSISFSGDGRRLVSCSGDQVRLWRLEAAEDPSVMRGHEWFVPALAISPDGVLLVSGSRDLRIWDIASGTLILDQPALVPHNLHTSLSFSSDGLRLADTFGAHVDGKRVPTAVVIDMRSGCIIRGPENLEDMTFGPMGRFIAARGAASSLLDADTYELVASLGLSRAVVSFDRRGRRLAVSNAGEQRVLDLPTLAVRRTWNHRGSGAHLLARDGSVLALATRDGGIALIDVDTGRERGVLRGHTGKVMCMAEMPDRNLLVSGADDRTLRLWDLDTLEELSVLRGHTDTVWAIVVTPDGRTIFSASGDYTIRRWDTRPVRELLAARDEYERIAARLAPRVRELLRESRDAVVAYDRIGADVGLTERERQIARQLILKSSGIGHPQVHEDHFADD